MKTKNSIRLVLNILFVSLIIIVTVLMGTVTYFNWNNSTNNLIKSIEHKKSEYILSEIIKFTNIPLDLNKITHDLMSKDIIDLSNRKEREQYFASMLKNSDNSIYSFAYGSEEDGAYYGARRNQTDGIELYLNDTSTNGHSYYYTAKDDLTSGEFVRDFGYFDPRTREWYKLAMEKKNPVFSSVYRHFVINDLAISASYPIYNDHGELKGVIATHFILSKINDYLASSSEDDIVYSAIIEKDTGELVANSWGAPNFINLEDKKYTRVNLKDMEKINLIKAYDNYSNGVITSTTKTDNDKLHINITEYRKNGLEWLIITAIPESQFTDNILLNMKVTMILCIIIIIFSIIILTKSINKFLHPIYELIDTSEKFSEGDFSQRVKIIRDDEIGELGQAFNDMAEQINFYIHNLGKEVKKRTKELEKLNDENRRLIATKDKFFAIISHDLRNSFNGIIGFSELLLEECKNCKFEEKYKSIETINESAKSTLQMLEKLLQWSTSQTGSIKFNPTKINMKNFLIEMHSKLKYMAIKKNINLKITKNISLNVNADKDMLETIFRNLITNAIKFTPKNGEILIKSERYNDNSDFLKISIIDDGVGMSEEVKNKLFKIGENISTVGTDNEVGNGLGLILCEDFIRKNGGEIFVDSKKNKGTIISYTLPLTK